ncbi:MAG: IS3 family transposase, partial [Thermoplasmataceae archaeon]
ARVAESAISKILEISEQRPTYGYRRIWAILRNDGIVLNQKTVMRVMKYHNLLLRPHSTRKKHGIELMEADSPDRLWETDLTYIPTLREGMTYLFNVKDCFTKEWLGYCYSRTCNRMDALKSVEDAILRHQDRYPDGRVNGTVLRCDNGDQYTSRYFRDRTRLLGFYPEFTEKDSPQQNGDIESLHNSIKTDYVWTEDFIDFNDADVKLSKAFIDYNNVRPHSSVDYLPPSVFRETFNNNTAFRSRYLRELKERKERLEMRRGKMKKSQKELEVKSQYA